MEAPSTKTHFIYYPTLIYISSLTVGFLLWYLLWLRPGYCSFPQGKYKFQTLLQSAIYKPKSLIDFCTKFGLIFRELDPEYWIPTCGTEIYYYLYSQRKIISLTLYLLGINFGVKLFAQVFEVQDWNIFHASSKDVDFSSNTVIVQHLIMITMFTIVFIVVIVKMIRHFSQVTLEYYTNVDKLDLKYLQLRTLHVRGMLPDDLNAELLKHRINNYLEDVGGKMVALKIIPNYSSLVKYETKRRDLMLNYTLFNNNKPNCKRLWLPKKFYDKAAYEKELQKLDKKIQEVTEKRFLSSGHAFVCFDSVTTMYKVLSILELKPNKILKHTIDSINAGVGKLADPLDNSRTSSTFQKYPPDRESMNHPELIANPATQSVDIVWRNMGGIRGIYFYRRIFINLLILTILSFASTPAGILMILNRCITNMEDYKWAYDISPDFGKLIKTGFPPLAILSIGAIILLLINTSTAYEKHIYQSGYQKSVFIKAIFYQTFNMVVIPGFGIIEKSSVFSAAKHFLDYPHSLLRNFYAYDSGAFFVTIIMQASIACYLIYFLRLEPLLTSYFSPWLLNYRQEYINEAENWSKKPTKIFEYGYLLAQTLIIFFIILLFSNTIPLVVIMGMLYFCIRHVVDSVNLLVMYRMELNSQGSLTRMMLLSLVLCCLLFQICYTGLLLDVKAYVAVLILLLNIGALVALFIYIRRPFFDLIDIEKRAEKHTTIAPEYINKWQEAYRHPLVLKHDGDKRLDVITQMEIILHPEKKANVEEQQQKKPENPLQVKSAQSSLQPSQGINIELSDSKVSIRPDY